MINTCKFPAYLKESKVSMLSKTNSNTVTTDNMRMIAISSHLTKVIEKIILDRAKMCGLHDTQTYQTGFTAGESTATNTALLLNNMAKW
jgi:hypothetical protein